MICEMLCLVETSCSSKAFPLKHVMLSVCNHENDEIMNCLLGTPPWNPIHPGDEHP